ncbi:MAG: VanZ family protein, partial [Pseudomonadota bacterium]
MEAEDSASEFAFAHRRLWLSLGWVLVLGVIYLSLTPDPIEVPVADGDKLGHLLAYGTLMVWFSNLYGNVISRLFFAIGFVAIGIALEFIQAWTGFRSFEIVDMAANASGVFVGWALAPPRTPNF